MERDEGDLCDLVFFVYVYLYSSDCVYRGVDMLRVATGCDIYIYDDGDTC